jgi:integrase
MRGFGLHLRRQRAPMVKEAFGSWFGEVCRAAGIRKSAHGLRKAGATRDAERGWSESELEAKYGWSGGQMASKYTRSMNRERLAVKAAERARRNNSGTSLPKPF